MLPSNRLSYLRPVNLSIGVSLTPLIRLRNKLGETNFSGTRNFADTYTLFNRWFEERALMDLNIGLPRQDNSLYII